MIEKTIDAWHQLISGQVPADRFEAALDDLLADEVIFYSPVVYTPQRGRDLTKMYLMAAGSTFNPVQTIRDELRGAVEGRAKMGPEKMGPEKPGLETPSVETRSLADATAQLKAEQEAAAPHAAGTHLDTSAAGATRQPATEAAEAPLPVPGSVDDPFGPPPEPPAAHPASEESKNGTTAR